MGGKESKQFPLTYDEAVKRVTDSERRRLQDAFRRLSSPPGSGYVNRNIFLREILGDGVPASIAERIFTICGGGASSAGSSNGTTAPSTFSMGTQSRGLSFRDTLTVLVLLTRGTSEEKTKFIFGLLTSENDNFIDRGHAERLIRDWEQGYCPQEVIALFAESNRVTYEQFVRWMDQNPECLGICRWILGPNSTLSLSNKIDTPTFYQTLAGVTHLEEQEIVELEKRFWSLSANTNQIDIGVIRPLVSPPLPSVLVNPLFAAFDENEDGHIDFKELSCGVSAACRGPETERQKFCFKVFDVDRDGRLSRAEVVVMLRCMKEVSRQSAGKIFDANDEVDVDVEGEADALLKNGENDSSSDFLSIEDYLVWTVNSELPKAFARLIFQLCHIVLGLRPQTRQEEGEIIRGWLEREEKMPLQPGSMWYVINMDWWSTWHAYVNSGNDSRGRRPFESGTSEDSTSSSTASTAAAKRTDSLNSTASSTPSPSPRPARKISGRPGLIENSCLVQPPPPKIQSLTGEGGKLRSIIQRGRDFELIPERLWKTLQQWYGGSLPLPRQVIRNNVGDIELELNPLSIKLLKHQSVPRPTHVPTVVGGYSAAALHLTGASYSVPTNSSNTMTRRFHAYQAAFSRRTTVRQIEDFLSIRLNVNKEDMRLWFFRDESNMRLLENDALTLEDAGFRDEDSILFEVRSRDGTWPEEISSLVIGDRRASVASISPPTVPGMIGLNNLGNTCYMNAALQCVANTKMLSQYFNSNCHLFELNRDNPLGFKGHIAKRFGDLVREMWSPNAKAIAPIKLRWTIGRYSSNFSGFQQQDSQEFLAFLLDGLHEDLNRVTEKPYSELKDSDGRPDLVVAQEAWENHIIRNKSVIVDLFHGQLKSKVTCKVCGHESVRFDPFTYLSLPLPLESSVRIEIVVIRQDGRTPVKYGITLDMEAKYSDLKPSLSQLCKISPQNLILVDIVHAQFRLHSPEEQKLKSLNGVCIYAYEFKPLTMSTHKNSKTFQIESLPDIQRSTTTSRPPSVKSEDHDPIVNQVNGRIPKQPEPVSASSTEVSSSWPAHICMSGISLCFKPNHLESNASKASIKMSTTATNSSNLESSETSTPLVDSPTNDSMKEIPLLSGEPGTGNGPGSVTSSASKAGHSRQSSVASSHSNESGKLSIGNAPRSVTSSSEELGDCHHGIVVALHRKMIPQEVYFLSTERYRPTLFGLPLIVPCSESTTYLDLYKSVWTQVSRLVSPLPPRDSSQNHATDCDDSLGYEYPFVLKVVQRGGSWCAWCPWHRFCRGCALPCLAKEFEFGASYLAIDWDQTALHLRYLANQEKAFVEDASVEASLKASTEPITLVKCLEAFTRQEELGENEKYYCSSCKKHQLASKKLQIWRLPPVLIVHLKRFHQLNGRWIKSHKIVDFPFRNLDPTEYLAAVPQKTLLRYKELNSAGKIRSSFNFSGCNGVISESSEPESDQIQISNDDLADSAANNEALTNGHVNSHGDEDEDEEENSSSKANLTTPATASHDDSLENDVFDETQMTRRSIDEMGRSFRRPLARNRQESTSLQTHPILDDNLQDFHQHRLLPGRHPLDINYNMYGMVCHSGVLGGGHYVSYVKSSAGKWFCHNDSSCKEVKEELLDKSTAYMLFYERESLSSEDYLPHIDSNRATPDFKDLDDDLDDMKKQCNIM